MVVSGINRGPNMGEDVIYSGTVAAAREGAILGIPSIAVSLNGREDLKWMTAGEVARSLVARILEYGLPKRTFLNVNVPNIDIKAIKGINLTSQGRRIYRTKFVKKKDSKGEECFWISGDEPSWKSSGNSDFKNVEDDRVSVTPMHLDLTDYSALEALRKQGWEEIGIKPKAGN